jgi:hypothetical protein
MFIVNTAIKFLNPLFPDDKKLHKYWWHWLFVALGIIFSSAAIVWVAGHALVFGALDGLAPNLGELAVDLFLPLVGKSVGLGILLPAILYRVVLYILDISDESGNSRSIPPGTFISKRSGS